MGGIMHVTGDPAGPAIPVGLPLWRPGTALEAEMEAGLATYRTEHWVGVREAAGVPCGPFYNYAQLFADPQVRHRGLMQYASDPELGEVPHIRTPIRSARACGCAPSPPSSASTMPRSSLGSG